MKKKGTTIWKRNVQGYEKERYKNMKRKVKEYKKDGDRIWKKTWYEKRQDIKKDRILKKTWYEKRKKQGYEKRKKQEYEKRKKEEYDKNKI